MAALLALLAATTGDAALRSLLPTLRAALAWVEPAFAVQHLDLVPGAAGSRVRTHVALAHTVVVGGRAVVPHPLGHAFVWVPASLGWLLPALYLTLVLAWPARGARERLWRLVVGLAALPALMLIDLPVVIVAEFWRPLMAVHDPQGWQAHVAWAGFLHGGGRVALALLAARVVVAGAGRAARAKV